MNRLFLTLIASFLLTACSLGAGTQDATTEVSQQMDKAPVVMEKGPAADLCTAVKQQENKAECQAALQTVADQYVYNEAVAYFDLAQCAKVADTVRQEDCKAKITESGVKGPISNEEMEWLISVRKNGDTAGCAQMTTEGLKAYCEAQNQRVTDLKKLESIFLKSNRSIEECDAIVTEEVKARCLKGFE